MNDSNRSCELVSVVMATYNGEKYIAQQIQSIIGQSYKNLELIIQDDCSDDATIEIARSFRDRVRISIEVNETRLGFVRNFERGVSRAAGDYIALSDQDDLWLENKIETLVASLGDADLIHSNCELVDEAGNTIVSNWKVSRRIRSTGPELLFYNDVTGCTALFRRDLLGAALPFPDGIAYHDWWFAMCAASRNGVRYLDLDLIKYRQHSGQDTGASDGGLSGMLGKIRKMRLFNGKAKKVVSQKQLRNLSCSESKLCAYFPKPLVAEALVYHRSLSSGFCHSRAFMIALRRAATIRPGDRLRYLKALSNDLLG